MHDHPSRRQALLFAAALAPLAPARADGPPLRMLVLDTEPFGMRAAGGELTGMYVDLARRLAREANVAMEVDIAPVPRVVQEINRGTADCTMLLAYEFDPRVRAVAPVISLEVLLWPRAGVVLTRPEDLAGRTVVSFRGTPLLRALPEGVDIPRQYVSTPRAMVAMLKAGRADVALGVRVTLMSGMRALGLRGSADEGFGEPLSLGWAQSSLWLRAGLPASLDETLGRALKALRQGGELQRLRQQYLDAGASGVR